MQTIRRFALQVGVLALAGCGWQDARHARDPLTSPLIGMQFPDLVHCMGPWDAWHQVDRDVFDVTWRHTSTSAAFKASLAVVGSISIGGGGGCEANVTVLRDGTVADVNFPQSFGNGLLTTPYQSCGTLVSECLHHADSTGRTAGYDVAEYLVGPSAPAAGQGKKAP